MKIYFAILVLLLLVGCTLQEQEVNKIIKKIDEMGKKLNELDDLAREEKFDEFRANVETADAYLDEVVDMIDEAEQRGEDAALVQRARKDTNYLKIQFQTLIDNVELVQKLEEIKPLMESLEGGDVNQLDQAIDSLAEILEDIENIKDSIDEMEAASEELSSQDAKMLKVRDALSNMRSFEKQISARQGEFSRLKTQLEDMKAQM